MVTAKQRERIIDALMELLQDRDWAEIGLADLAERAQVRLATLREAFSSKLAVLEAFSARIDAIVLGEETPSLEESPRERLFDILMRRFDALVPYRPALRRLASAARRDPGLALGLARNLHESMRWMLTAAGISAEGVPGFTKAQDLSFSYARAMRVFLEEEDPGLSRTMATLDASLREGERRLRTIGALARGVSRIFRLGEAAGARAGRARGRRGEEEAGEDGEIAGSGV